MTPDVVVQAAMARIREIGEQRLMAYMFAGIPGETAEYLVSTEAF